MGVYVTVVFVDPLEAGAEFPASEWPLHITLVRFDSAAPLAEIAGQLGAALQGRTGFEATVGEDAGFGRNGAVPVSLVDPGSGLAELHEALLEALVQGLGQPIHLPSPHHTRAGYRPHVTHRNARLGPGDTVRVKQVALVDMFPDADRRLRRVLAVWPLAAEGPAAPAAPAPEG